MKKENLTDLIKNIVSEAIKLKDKYTDEKRSPVNYVAVFSHSKKEYKNFSATAETLSKAVQKTSTGTIYILRKPVETNAGKLQIVKVRKPDTSRPEMGDADFTVNYDAFKKKYAKKKGFQVVVSSLGVEMIELSEKCASIRCYFSQTPVIEKIGV